MSSYDREIIIRIREIADGRRHYDGSDDFTCFDALGEIRKLCDEALEMAGQSVNRKSDKADSKCIREIG